MLSSFFIQGRFEFGPHFIGVLTVFNKSVLHMMFRVSNRVKKIRKMSFILPFSDVTTVVSVVKVLTDLYKFKLGHLKESVKAPESDGSDEVGLTFRVIR